MLKKIFIMIWFGPLPEWTDQWIANMERLKPLGYDYLMFTNLEMFKARVRDKLDLEPNILPQTGKPWDYRAMLGVLFEEEIKGYDFFGHTDFDCVYGNVDKWVTDEFLDGLDVHSNHNEYICGPWTLYRNIKEVRELYMKTPSWRPILMDQRSTGWVEMEYSRLLENSGLRYKYTLWQNKDFNIDKNIRWDNGLYDGDEEIMMFHFKRTKRYPLERYEI